LEEFGQMAARPMLPQHRAACDPRLQQLVAQGNQNEPLGTPEVNEWRWKPVRIDESAEGDGMTDRSVRCTIQTGLLQSTDG
jgi:hypothetical protein